MAERRVPVSAIVHTRDSEETIERCLRSLAFADEVVVVDMASIDRTVAIARPLATEVHAAPVTPRVDAIRNRWIERLCHEWVLVVDSDEWLAEDAAAEVQRLIAEHGDRYDAFSLPRFDEICGQVLRSSGWYPDHQIRLFRKGTVHWRDATHELPEVRTGRGRLLELTPPDCVHLHHRNYRDLRHFIEKQVAYALRDLPPGGDPRDFDFGDYVARAYEALALRADVERDGDLSQALALLLAWDQLIRGLLHWESLTPRPPLDLLGALPVATERVSWWRVRARRWLGRRHSLGYYVRRAVETYRDWRAR